jgi:integrase/recombinase XerD
MLAAYAARRDVLCPSPASPAFFITRTGRRPVQGWAQGTFARLLIQAGISQPPGRRRPRIHDYADTFVMPMPGRSACSAVVSGLKVSA